MKKRKKIAAVAAFCSISGIFVFFAIKTLLFQRKTKIKENESPFLDESDSV